jgi:hypothetical protein
VDVVGVRVTVDNACFADAYVGRGELQQAADKIRGSPASVQETREVTFGSFGLRTAGGAVRLECFFCNNIPGHTASRAILEEDYPKQELPQCATVVVDFEPAALDQFVRELGRVDQITSVWNHVRVPCSVLYSFWLRSSLLLGLPKRGLVIGTQSFGDTS